TVPMRSSNALTTAAYVFCTLSKSMESGSTNPSGGSRQGSSVSSSSSPAGGKNGARNLSATVHGGAKGGKSSQSKPPLGSRCLVHASVFKKRQSSQMVNWPAVARDC